MPKSFLIKKKASQATASDGEGEIPCAWFCALAARQATSVTETRLFLGGRFSRTVFTIRVRLGEAVFVWSWSFNSKHSQERERACGPCEFGN